MATALALGLWVCTWVGGKYGPTMEGSTPKTVQGIHWSTEVAKSASLCLRTTKITSVGLSFGVFSVINHQGWVARKEKGLRG